MNKPAHHLRPPQSYIRGLEKTNEYLGFMTEGKERSSALGHTARTLAERMSQAESQTVEQKLDQSAVHILSLLPKYLESQLALDKIQDYERATNRRVPKTEKRPHKEVAASYNHALRELVDIAPDLAPSEVLNFIYAAALEMEDPDAAKYASQETRSVIFGMQNEIGFEQILWEIEEVEDVIHGDEKQDREGVDLYILYKGVKLKVDTKASALSAQKAKQARQDFMRRHGETEASSVSGYPMWTGLKASDFGDTFRISNELARERAPHIKAMLDNLYERQSQVA